MLAPLLMTKLYIPPVRRTLVSRPRLIERMSQGMHRRLTLISAPAGFGKTTLLSECAACCGRPVAWLTLDEGDNDLARFLAYLIAALQSIDPRIGKQALGALQAPQAPPAVSLLVGLINELAAMPGPFLLVLDDYHLAEARPLHDAVTFLLDHQPPHMHVVISTRIDPPLPIARLRARGELTEVRQKDLRFSVDETVEFLNKALSLRLSMDDVAALSARTEGWIAGLQMAAVSLQGQDDSSGFVRAFAGSHRYVLDYLMEEVLSRQPADVQDFLLQTSILDRLSGPLCDAVLGEEAALHLPTGSSQEILEHLDRTNLFVVPLDEERRWYRYHHLLADLLHKRLEQTRSDSMRELHHRASTWYEQQGLMSEAIGHALSAKEFPRALQLIESVAESSVMRSELATLKGWLEALPTELVLTRPLLCVYHTWALLLGGSPVEVAEARLQDAVAADADQTFAGEVLAARAVIAAYQGRTRYSAELSRRALELLPGDRLFFRSFVAGILGFGTLLSGDLVAARLAFQETVKIGRQAGNLTNTVLALCHLGEVSGLESHVHEARAFYEEALALAVDDQGQRQPIAGMALIGLGRLLTWQYKLQDAARILTEGIELIKRWGAAGAVGGYVGLAKVRRNQGDLEGAREAIRTAEGVAASFEAMTADDDYVAGEKARLWLAQGDVDAVLRWVKERGLDKEVSLCQREQDGGDFVPLNRVVGYMIAAQTYMAQHRPDQALRVLGPLRVMAEAAGWTAFVGKFLILESLALQAQGDIPEALHHLARALALIEPEGGVESFLEEGMPMVELLRHAATRGIEPQRTGSLLALFEAGRSAQVLAAHPPTPAARIQPLAEPLSERELDVLRLLASPLSTVEIADRLFVSVSTVRSHTKNIYGKLNVHRRLDAAERARDLKLL